MANTSRAQRASAGGAALGLLQEFRPLADLWHGGTYPSEQSARWAIRTHRTALVAAGALALHRGRVFVHLARFSKVVERAAIDRAAARARTAAGDITPGVINLEPPADPRRRTPT